VKDNKIAYLSKFKSEMTIDLKGPKYTPEMGPYFWLRWLQSLHMGNLGRKGIEPRMGNRGGPGGKLGGLTIIP
jgi:hypothetical protein